MRVVRLTWLILFCAIAIGMFAGNVSAADNPAWKTKTENIIYIMADGLRWQEVFTGAEEALCVKEYSGDDMAKLRYWRKTPEKRREALMPFLWEEIAKNGQIFGNKEKGSSAQVTNGLNFSYPGYSETLCGYGDPRVNSNDPKPNPNINVLEWLNHMKPYKDRVAAFGAWSLFPSILNEKRSGLFINSGYDLIKMKKMTPNYELLNRLKQETIRYWEGEPFDSIPFETSLEYFKREKPRVFYLSLGETDEWGHDKRYDKYLDAAHLADMYIKIIWETAQSMRQYRGKTTLILSTDHGRGLGSEWTSHGEKCKGSEDIWMAFMGPDTPPLGERTNIDRVTESQLAATVASFLGRDFCAFQPLAAKPIADVRKPVE